MKRRTLRVGTRASPLARAQAAWVAARLERRFPGLRCELVPITTQGDRDRSTPLHAMGGSGVFVKELEQALGAGEIDLAVHSAKDVPSRLPEGFFLAAFPQREWPADALVLPRRAQPTQRPPDRPREGGGDLSPPPPAGPESPSAVDPPSGRSSGGVTGHPVQGIGGGGAWQEGWMAVRADQGCRRLLPPGARVGTSSLRRQAFLLAHRPDLTMVPIRGNLGTRLQRLDAGEVDALVLAAAGLRRVGLGRRIDHLWPLDVLPPAPGQGALAVEVRADDPEVRRLVRAIDRPEVARAVRAERAFLAELGGSCRVPLAAYAWAEGARMALMGAVAGPGGEPCLRAEIRGSAAHPEDLGRRLAEGLLALGAGELLAAAGVENGTRPPSLLPSAPSRDVPS